MATSNHSSLTLQDATTTMNNDPEKAARKPSTVPSDRTRGSVADSFHPTPAHLQRPSTNSSSSGGVISHTRSQNGYGVSDEEGIIPRSEGQPQTHSPEACMFQKDPFEVGWVGGDSDPACPRSFSKARKWLIVMIVCNGSFCV